MLHALLGLARDSHIYQIVMMLTALVILLIGLRALFQPLILRYGGPTGDDTRGSARFATDRETWPFVQGGDSLLIAPARAWARSYPICSTIPASISPTTA